MWSRSQRPNLGLLEIPLLSSSVSAKSAWLREPRTRDELEQRCGDPVSMTEFVAALLVPAPGRLASDDVWGLSVPDRDRLLAALYRSLYGDRIESIVACTKCGEPFELGFTLRELLASLDGQQHASTDPRVRLPTAADEREISSLGAEAAGRRLLTLCAPTLEDAAVVANLWELQHRAIDIDLQARCVHCAAEQSVRFDIVSFLHQRLRDERDVLVGEVHCLASSYGWPWSEIAELPRSVRRALVKRAAGAERSRGQA